MVYSSIVTGRATATVLMLEPSLLKLTTTPKLATTVRVQ